MSPGSTCQVLVYLVAVDTTDQQALAVADPGDGVNDGTTDGRDPVNTGTVNFLTTILDVEAQAISGLSPIWITRGVIRSMVP